MPNPSAPARPANAAPGAQQNDESPWNNIFGVVKVRRAQTLAPELWALMSAIASVFRLDNYASWCVLYAIIVVVYARFISCVVSKFFAPKTNTQTPSPVSTPVQVPPAAAGHAPGTPAPVLTHAYPAWPLGIPLAMHVYLTTSPTANVFSGKNQSLPNFTWENITFGDWSDTRVVEFDVNIPYVSLGVTHLNITS